MNTTTRENLSFNPRYIIAAQVTKAVVYAALNEHQDGLVADGHCFQTICNDHDKGVAFAQAVSSIEHHYHHTVSIWRRVGNPMSSLYAIVRPSVPLLAQERHAPTIEHFITCEEQRLERAISELQHKLTMLHKL